ncbi:TPA: Y-family DNA polymerase [Elizabethkingia anophelis]|uniref:Y-family DNA polymerase n=1 Tax=Elizabethkingia anophelis TaxID=1117645 RepID=UPI0021A7818A|nr:Y-family DNA polymerase [Elizabethkingia anophelis]MCT4054923.1 Y-family DNA polymerase [Elizabethkingia anophelis]MCT4086699.1 Y-family DNA polymerase [Elizabethkingia anophelis]MCT4104475.1 Y-family DNA polymerase [Elizabethkingia anophelis]HAY3503879.1 Y-family DNA polymerase [Elizabethkingia anophelis]
MYALVDCNNFYASCERSFDPLLNGKPVVVLSNNDGCAIARSNEAKALGIPMGAAAFEYEKLFQENDVKVFSTNFALYGDMSKRVMKILSEYTPDVEVYSIDEIFLKFKGYENYDLHKYGLKMKSDVFRNTRIPVSIGYAPTKALAKVANRIAKKFPDITEGVYIIDSEEKRIKALKWLKIEDVWGIGRQFSKKLTQQGVLNAYQFTQLPDYYVKKEMSIVGLRLKKELLGEEYIELEEKKRKKAIATTRSFDKNYREYDIIKERVSTFASRCAEKLRKEGSYCSEVIVFIHTNFFRKDQPQYSKSIKIKIPQPTNSSITISKYAIKALNQIFIEGFAYKKAGVIVSKISPEPFRQFNLFENEDPRHGELMKALDKINKALPNPIVKLASQDFGRREKMKQERLSPRYTTKWEELIEVE